MSDALLYDFHLFWMAVALVVALVGCGCMTVGLILRHTFVRPTTPEAFVRIAGELCRQRIIPPWLPVDALTLQQLETYQRSSTQAGLICRGVGVIGGALVCFVSGWARWSAPHVAGSFTHRSPAISRLAQCY